ncbi:MAG: hypothetical protein N2C14_15960, partial [Planctomycetales bacterium]
MEYQFNRCTKRCAESGRELAEGELYYSVLLADGADWKRVDFSTDAWSGPPPEAVGWWQSRIPTKESTKAKLAPNEVLKQFFAELRERGDRPEMLYVLTLLMLRRRILRPEEGGTSREDELACCCPRAEETYRIPA